MSLTNNTGSRVKSNEEPLTGQSGPVNLASKMPTKEKTNSKEKKRRHKKVRDIQTVSSSQPHRIQPEGHKEPNLFLECLLANQPKSTERSSSLNQPPPLPSTQTGDSSTLELLRSNHAQGLYPYPFAEPSTYRTKDNQQHGGTHTIATIADSQTLSSKEFKEWSGLHTKGHTKSNFQTWVEERERDKRLLATSTGWGRGLG